MKLKNPPKPERKIQLSVQNKEKLARSFFGYWMAKAKAVEIGRIKTCRRPKFMLEDYSDEDSRAFARKIKKIQIKSESEHISNFRFVLSRTDIAAYSEEVGLRIITKSSRYDRYIRVSKNETRYLKTLVLNWAIIPGHSNLNVNLSTMLPEGYASDHFSKNFTLDENGYKVVGDFFAKISNLVKLGDKFSKVISLNFHHESLRRFLDHSDHGIGPTKWFYFEGLPEDRGPTLDEILAATVTLKVKEAIPEPTPVAELTVEEEDDDDDLIDEDDDLGTVVVRPRRTRNSTLSRQEVLNQYIISNVLPRRGRA